MQSHHPVTFVISLLLAASLRAGGQRYDEHSLKLSAEAVGHLSVTLDVKSKKISEAKVSCWKNNGAVIHIRLNLADDNEMHELVRKLDRQLVRVTGMFEIWIDPPMGRMPFPTQYSLRVETLKAVPKVK